ncbi:MAG TPA: sigma-70 family RNA polymerase sigma factor [Longimicrobiales bacterium]|nr:sigma-70 family RNA polymerase sigma factor [Longimicrobiales bacterium]
MDFAALSDQDVVARAAEGHERAYRELISRYERPVFSLIYRLVHDRERAEDLAQETFIKVLNAIDRYDATYKFSSWIFKIANNTAIDALRKRSLDTVSLDGSPHARSVAEAAEGWTPTAVARDENPEEYVERLELGDALEAALASLRPEYRTAIVLWHMEDRPYEEIADIMDIPLGTVKTYIHRARKELRNRLAGATED